MSDLEKFDVSKQTKPTRNALAETMWDMFSVLRKWLVGTISHVFASWRPNGKKGQISRALEKYERWLRKMRRIMK